MPGGAESVSVIVYVSAAVAMLVPIYSFTFTPIFTSFLVLEGLLGMYNSSGATLRSQYYPQAKQSSIMNVFRVSLNLVVRACVRQNVI